MFLKRRGLKSSGVFPLASNHTIGFYPRDKALGADESYRPDGYYGLSKAYGEPARAHDV